MDSQSSRRRFLGDIGRTSMTAWLGLESLAAWTSLGSAYAADTLESTSRGILRLRLFASRLDEMRIFYGETLGFEVRREPDALVVNTGETRIRFERAAPGTAPYYHLAWAIPENRLEESMEWMRRRTQILPAPDGREIFDFRHVRRRAFFFADPAGNILEFIVRHDLEDGVRENFQRKHILYVNHVGLVVDDMDASIALVQRGLGLVPKRQPSPHFTSLGDDHRHITLVTRNRLWLPDRVKAADVYQAEIVLHGAEARVLEFEEFPYRVAIEA